MQLRKLGTGFPDKCLERREFLVPRLLDRVVFEDYAPESAGESSRYLDANGIVFVSPQNDGYYISLLGDRSSFASVGYDDVV